MSRNNLREVEYSTPYLMSDDELKIFLRLLLRDKNSQHTAFIVVLLKELDYDIAKFLRVINVGFKTQGLIQKSLQQKVLSTIRQAVVIKDLEFRDVLSKFTISQMARSPRYRELGITRFFIYSVITRHNLDVLDREGRV